MVLEFMPFLFALIVLALICGYFHWCLVWCPSPPSDIFCEWQDACVVIHWSTVLNANAYEVLYRDWHHQQDWCVIPNVLGTSYSLPISNGLYYEISVRAINECGSRQSHETRNGRSRASAPVNFTASYDDCTGRSIHLEWEPVINGTGYHLQRRTIVQGNNFFSTIWTTDAPWKTDTDDNDFTYGINYEYILFSIDAAGLSMSSTAITLSPRVPAPRELIASSQRFRGPCIRLEWEAVSGAKGYVVQRKKMYALAMFSVIQTTGPSSISTIEDYSIQYGVKYYYAVKSVDDAGQSKPSNEVNILPRVPAPDGLMVDCNACTAHYVVLQWKQVVGCTGYIVKRALNRSNAEFVTIQSFDESSTTSITDKTFTHGKAYKYVVFSTDYYGPSGSSEEAYILPRAPAPTDLRVSYGEHGTRAVVLNWKIASESTGHVIERTRISNTEKYLPAVEIIPESPGTKAEDTSFTYGLNYKYIVVSVDHAGASQRSNPVYFHPRVPAVTNLKASFNEQTGDSIILKWKAERESNGYIIRRTTTWPSKHFVTVVTLNDSFRTTVEDKSFTCGVTYYYVVFTIDKAGESSHSSPASIIPRAAPPTDVCVCYDEYTSLSMTIQWKPVMHVKGYRVQRENVNLVEEQPTIWNISDPLTTTIEDTLFLYGCIYQYCVISVDAAGESKRSQGVSICRRAPPPTLFKSETPADVGGTVILDWQAVSRCRGYYVCRKYMKTLSTSIVSSSKNPEVQKNKQKKPHPVGNFLKTNELSAATNEMCIVASLEDPMICQCVDNSAQNGIEYLYTIQSLDIQGASPHSVRASGMAKLPPPQKLVVEPLHEQGMCLLSWNSVVAAVGYRIERKDAATAWITIGRLVDGPTKFVDSSQLIYDTTYSYKIYAFDAFSESLPTLYPGAVMLLSPKHQDEKPGAIDIRFGDLVTEQVDAIVVCSTSNGLLKSVLDVAGPGVNQNFHKPKNRNQERALILPAVKLPFKKIVFIPWRPDAVTGLSIENSVRNFVITAIELAVKNKCNTLSFPAIGCGAFNCDTKLVAKGMLFEADRILQAKNSTVRQVSIIIEKTKQTVFDTFKGMLEVQIASRLTAKGNDLPLEWTAIDDEYPLRIGLSSSSEEYRSILGALRETLSEAQTQSARVERIQNTRWYCQYQLEKKDLCKRLKTETERRLFHGCPNQGDALESIARNGFDRSLAGAHRGTRYGAGVYFSTKASESHKYAVPNTATNERTMFVCSVLVGLIQVGQPDTYVCPEGYHSTTDGHSIHVIYRDAQAYAQYLVHYICPGHLSNT